MANMGASIIKSVLLHLLIIGGIIGSASFHMPSPKVLEVTLNTEPMPEADNAVAAVTVDQKMVEQKIAELKRKEDAQKRAEDKRIRDLERRANNARKQREEEARRIKKLEQERRAKEKETAQAQAQAKKAREIEQKERAKALQAEKQKEEAEQAANAAADKRKAEEEALLAEKQLKTVQKNEVSWYNNANGTDFKTWKEYQDYLKHKAAIKTKEAVKWERKKTIQIHLNALEVADESVITESNTVTSNND